MKKVIYLLIAIALFGCNIAEYAPIETENYSIEATMEGEDTKTSVTDAGYFTWSDGDKIWLHTTNGGVEGVLSDGAGTPNATFSYGAYVGSMTGNGVYPFGNHSILENTLTVNLPTSYDLGESTDNTNAAMYAVVVNGTLKFTHLAGVMRFEFKDAPVGTNQFKITLDKRINGEFTVDLTKEGYPTLTVADASKEEDKTVTINFTPLEETKNLRIYVPLPIGTYNSLALELNAGDKAVYKYSKEISNTINRKSLLLMPTISMGGSIGGDIENDGSIEGDIEDGEEGNLYIRFDDGSTYKDLGVFSAAGTSSAQSITLDTNVETGFQVEYPEGMTWVDAYVSNGKLKVTVIKNKAFARSTTIKATSKADPSVYAEIKLAQESAIEETMTYKSYACLSGHYGSVTDISDNSLDFIIESGAQYDYTELHYAIYFDTNISDYNFEIAEDGESWLGESGINRANDLIVIVPTINDQLERSSSIEIKCPHTGKVFYTINVIQLTNPAAYVDLSTNETANCYVVSETGAYKFSPTKGNTSESVGSIYSVDVLWESKGTGVSTVGSIIKKTSYNYGYIEFTTPEVFEEGNAVIAAKDRDGKILWSWHIWLTDAPKENVYGTAGSMLDRNLGALTSGVAEYNTAGLLYQWGRKDPFLGANSMSDNDPTKKGSSATWPSVVESSSSTGTIAYAIENPMTFITSNSNNSDWYYTTTNSSDHTRWNAVKTEYDPCPAGWRAPDGGDNSIWSKSGYPDNGSWNYSNHTKYFYIDGEQVGYPATPPLRGTTGKLYQPEEAAGWDGRYWSCTTDPGNTTNVYGLQILYPGYTFTNYSTKGLAEGYAIRCQKDL